ncbi:hypothetical protein RD792_003581 [Penstemon davidsonii]|uniref:Protein kinase domain-containing protein n=1 Tax=Penstemon davidsonii TaxID=160366 RepID=A0ABR0DF39_9LAMI|nr:hypothetical protein RD792_003581 [Penstemon davidsonii]
MNGFIDGGHPMPNLMSEGTDSDGAKKTPNPTYIAWRRSERLLRGWITGTLSEEVLSLVVGLETASEVWKALENSYALNSQEREVQLMQNMSLLRKGEGGFGHVYKGWIHEYNLTAAKLGSGMDVAIKKWNPQGLQGHQEWMGIALRKTICLWNLMPKLSDFGLARYRPNDDTHLSPHVMGTYGYATPEYVATAYRIEGNKKGNKELSTRLTIPEGGFGHVYKGWIHEYNMTAAKPGSGMAVAVLKWNPPGCQGHQEWMDELNYLSKLQHPNLVKLIGHCSEEDNLLLVYEFMPKGSLNNHLFARRNQSLSWATRIKVATDAARALSFLHGLEKQVIHRGLNSGDILLDGEFNAKLSDFGLAKNGPTGDMTHVSTRVMGTYGYAAPEYVATGPSLNRKMGKNSIFIP